MIIDQYCEKADIENILLKSISSGFEDQVEDWIRGVSRMMDTMANRKLVAPAIGSGEDYEEEYFDGDGSNYLLINDCQEITELNISDTFGDENNIIDPVNYALIPRKAPYKAISLRNDIFTRGRQNIIIKGRFGLFNEIPADIRFACAVLVAGIINDQDKGNATKKSESIGNYSVSYIDDKGISDYNRAIDIVKSYRKITM